MSDESLRILNITWLFSSSTVSGSLGNWIASSTAYFVVPACWDRATSTGSFVIWVGTNMLKYGRPQPMTMVSPAAVEGYGFSTLDSALSSRVCAVFSALTVQLRLAASFAVKTSLWIGGMAQVTPLSRITST